MKKISAAILGIFAATLIIFALKPASAQPAPAAPEKPSYEYTVIGILVGDAGDKVLNHYAKNGWEPISIGTKEGTNQVLLRRQN